MKQTKHDQPVPIPANRQSHLISVIVPVYNTAPYLARALDSILSSTCTSLEVLLIDDGSSDGSSEICDAYASRDPRISVFHMGTNHGAGSARNKGIELARGAYLAFADSDDTVEPRMYEALLCAIRETHSDLAICRYKSIYPDRIEDGSTNAIRIWEGARLFEEYVMSDIGISGKIPQIGGYISNKLYPSSVIRDIRFSDGCWEDSLFNTQVLYRVKKAVYLDTAYYNYYPARPGSITNSSPAALYFDYRKIVNEKNKFYTAIRRTDLADLSECFYFFRSFRYYYLAVDHTDLPEAGKQALKASVRQDFSVHKKQLRDICRRRTLPPFLRVKLRMLLCSPSLYLKLFQIRNFLWRCWR